MKSTHKKNQKAIALKMTLLTSNNNNPIKINDNLKYYTDAEEVTKYKQAPKTGQIKSAKFSKIKGNKNATKNNKEKILQISN